MALQLTDEQMLMVMLTGNIPDANYNGSHNCISGGGGQFIKTPDGLDKSGAKIVDAEMKRLYQHKNGRRKKRQKITFNGIERQEKVRNRLRKKVGLPKLD